MAAPRHRRPRQAGHRRTSPPGRPPARRALRLPRRRPPDPGPFKGPGYTADAFLDRDTDKYDVTETTAVAVVNDLHRGASTGPAWSFVIDACAILLAAVSLIGLILLVFLYKRRTAGLILAAAGALLCWVVYARFVP